VIYETEANRIAQARIAAKVAQHFGLACEMLPLLAPIDAKLLDETGRPQLYVEVKARNLTFGRRDGYYLSVSKIRGGEHHGRTEGAGCYLAVEFDDGIIRIAPLFRFIPDHLIRFGRRDRNDPADINLCVVYPWSVFVRVQ
jgi:hypothetical protein